MDATPADGDRLLGFTISEAAARMGVSKRTVERWIKSGDLPVFRRGRVVRVPVAAIERFRASGSVSAAPSSGAPAGPRALGRGRLLRPGERLWD